MSSSRAHDLRKRQPWSLAARLSAWYAGSAFLLVVAVTVFLYGVLVANLEREDDQLLADEFQSVRSLLIESPNDLNGLKQRLKWEASARQHFQFLVRILGREGDMLVESPGMSDVLPLRLVETHASGAKSVEFETPSGRSFHVLVRQIAGDDSNGPWTVHVAMDRTFEEELLTAYRHGLVAVLFVSLVLCTVVGYQIAQRGLRPLREMAATSSRIRSTTLHERIDARGLPTELSLLASTFNEMLDRLEESFARLSRFSADIAHELRTPVNNLRGEAEVALGKPRSPEAYREVLGSCLEECERLSRMIDSLLFLARAERTQAALNAERVDIGRELESVREFYDAAAAEAGITLTVRVHGELFSMLDRTLFQRAVGNLVSNAFAHTPAGGAIAISASMHGDKLHVEVRDTGAGIAEDHLRHVFDRFYRADASRSAGGVGLGLAIVRSIATMHGGSAEITSSFGKGTSVTLKLPAIPNTVNQ